MSALLDNVARCHDDRCEVRETCLRWIERLSGGQRTVHCGTLRLRWQCHDELCDNAITGNANALTSDEFVIN